MERIDTIELGANGLHFSALASGDGPVALCLHGFPDHLRSFRLQLGPLADAGYRAIAPALRGYEPASQPGTDDRLYHPLRIADDVARWAEAFGRVHLVGHDWGAIVAYLAAAQRPELFHSLTTLAVPHFAAMRAPSAWRIVPRQLRNSWYVFFFQLRGIAERRVERDDFAFVERLWRDWSPGFRWDTEEMARLKQTFREPGVLRSALAYYRSMLSPTLPETRRMNAALETPIAVPTLAITGATDGCLDTRLFDHMPARCFSGPLRVERIEGAGHFVHQEDPDRVNTLLVEWLDEHRGGARRG